jgi:hypothetical protein
VWADTDGHACSVTLGVTGLAIVTVPIAIIGAVVDGNPVASPSAVSDLEADCRQIDFTE